MKHILFLSFLICVTFKFGYAQLLDTYDIGTSPNGVIAMPTGLPSSYSTFVKYTKIQAPNGQAIHIIAQSLITEAQTVRARNILQFYLTNVPGSHYGTDKTVVTNKMGTNESILMLLNGSDGDSSPPNINAQPLYQNEMAVEGHQWYINNDYDNHRDAAYEEILHLMHDNGIGVDGANTQPGALPAYQAEIRAAQDNADNNNFQIWPLGAKTDPSWYNELAQENSLSQEYLASVVDNYYGLWGAWTESTEHGMWGEYISKTRAEIETEDPMGWALMPKYFSPFIDINMDIAPTFNGTFTMTFNAAQPYTHKSQYLQHCTLTGTTASNLIGNDQYNRLNGNNANNILEGGKGNDRLDGKDGTDIAKFTGNFATYTILTQSEKTIISDNTNNRDGTDTLFNVETLRFTDGDRAIPTGGGNSVCTEQQLIIGDNLSGNYQGINTLTATGTVAAMTAVTLKAGQSVILSTGFHAVANSTFWAKIAACPATVTQKNTTERSSYKNTFSSLTSNLDLKAYPNPFLHHLTIDYSLAKAEKVNLFIIDIMGRTFAQLEQQEWKPKGQYQRQFYLKDKMQAGTYFLVMQTEEQYLLRQLILLKK